MADRPSEIEGVFHRPFTEQVAYFRGKLGNLVPTARWDDISREAHDRAFMVAGAAKADLLADLAAAVDRAITEGQGLEAFRKDFRDIVEKNGWHGWTGEGTKAGEAWRTRTIYRTNAKVSYAAGRHAQLVEGEFPLWVYRHGGSREPRPQHLAWDGLTLPADHEFWATNAPPNGWGCSCYILGARSEAGARRLGGDPGKDLPPDWNARDPKTGAPKGIDRGWDYAPGKSVVDDTLALARRIERHPALIGAHFGGSVSARIAESWRAWLTDLRAGRRRDDGFLGVLHADDVTALSARGVEPESAEIFVKAGLLRGPKARRHEARGDALSPAEWDALALSIRSPRAVLQDTKSGKLIYLLAGEDGSPQLAIDVEYWRAGRAGKRVVNGVVSAYRVREDVVRQRLRGGELVLLRGDVG